MCHRGAEEAPVKSAFGIGHWGSSDVLISNVRCTGRESNLLECPNIVDESCSISDAASVSCRKDQGNNLKIQKAHISEQLLISPQPVKPEKTIGLHSVCLSFCLSARQSVCHTRFPDFSLLCSHISWWKLIASFRMMSYRLRSTFFTDDLIFHELLPFVQNLFSGHFSALLSRIWMKVCSKLPIEE